MLNEGLLRAVRDKILMEPDQHRQASWMTVQVDEPLPRGTEISCPTTGCVAGWACAMSGDLALVDSASFEEFDAEIVYTIWEVLTPKGQVLEIEERGAQLLGLDEYQAEELFDGQNSRDTVLKMLDDLIKEASEPRH